LLHKSTHQTAEKEPSDWAGILAVLVIAGVLTGIIEVASKFIVYAG
jgi:hypothetical protein